MAKTGVMTTGGIHGKIADVQETTVTLDVGNNVHFKVDKTAIIQNAQQETK